jgi:cathepsin L
VRDFGIFKESEYPYKGYAQACQKEKADFKIYAHHYIDSCSDLQEKLLINPISVSVDSSMWKFYKSGIFNDCPSSPQADHAVLVVGMSEKYWLIKNSWSSAWG